MIACHADHIGSLLRPPELISAREDAAAGRIYWATAAAQIYLMTIYGKSERSDIDRETLRRIAKKLELLE